MSGVDIEQLAAPAKEPTINFAIGPNCPVRCEGCYNHFGDTALSGVGLVTASEVIDFARVHLLTTSWTLWLVE